MYRTISLVQQQNKIKRNNIKSNCSMLFPKGQLMVSDIHAACPGGWEDLRRETCMYFTSPRAVHGCAGFDFSFFLLLVIRNEFCILPATRRERWQQSAERRAASSRFPIFYFLFN